jgi:hypothetical protein
MSDSVTSVTPETQKANFSRILTPGRQGARTQGKRNNAFPDHISAVTTKRESEFMAIDHPKLVKQLRLAYSAEKAAAFAYIGHAGSVKDPNAKVAIKQIEMDEWSHRETVLSIMRRYDIPVSRYNEVKYHIIGRFISLSCYVIGWFMPYYFAGRLESGNVCEYFVMMHSFNELGITEHDEVLYEMGIKEKEHEVYFRKNLTNNRLLPVFEKIFGWGNLSSFNDVDLENKYSVTESKAYCRRGK